ncbi:MAG TPA: glycosyltransferase [Puia sp.]
MKRLLIISPNFPPINAPDMQRIRMSLPYYREMGWEPEVLCVDEQFIEGFRDPLLLETVPPEIAVHKVGAWPAAVTRKFGLGSLSMRSYFHFKKKGNELLRSGRFDLVFFSTTMFHVCALGAYWKRKFGVPFVIDMQDPWRNDFYLSQPRSQRPPKFRIAYTIDKRLEAATIPSVDGIISVSKGYIQMLNERYPVMKTRPAVVLPFGTSERDFDLIRKKQLPPEIIQPGNGKINVVYVGAMTKFFLPLLRAFFQAFASKGPDRSRYHFYFIGTNYVPGAEARPVEELAAELGLKDIVTEHPGRIPYFSALATLMHADILFIPGSTDPDYNASKVYNNILAGRPIFSVFNEKSLVKKVIEDSRAGLVVGVNGAESEAELVSRIAEKMEAFGSLHLQPAGVGGAVLAEHSAASLTKAQVSFFNSIVPS